MRHDGLGGKSRIRGADIHSQLGRIGAHASQAAAQRCNVHAQFIEIDARAIQFGRGLANFNIQLSQIVFDSRGREHFTRLFHALLLGRGATFGRIDPHRRHVLIHLPLSVLGKLLRSRLHLVTELIQRVRLFVQRHPREIR